MNWKNRLTNYNFWVSMVSAILLIFQAFNLKFDIMYINEIATAVLGLLVVIGIVSDPTKISVKSATGTHATIKESEVNEPAKKEDKKEVEDVIPVEVKNENGNIFNQDDFKVLIEKISSDLQNITGKFKDSANEEKIISIPETKPEDENKTETINFNIVN